MNFGHFIRGHRLVHPGGDEIGADRTHRRQKFRLHPHRRAVAGAIDQRVSLYDRSPARVRMLDDDRLHLGIPAAAPRAQTIRQIGAGGGRFGRVALVRRAVRRLFLRRRQFAVPAMVARQPVARLLLPRRSAVDGDGVVRGQHQRFRTRLFPLRLSRGGARVAIIDRGLDLDTFCDRLYVVDGDILCQHHVHALRTRTRGRTSRGDRDSARPSQGTGGCGQSRQIDLPLQDEPRVSHSAQRRDRLQRNPARRRRNVGSKREKGRSRAHQRRRQASALARYRRARHLQDRIESDRTEERDFQSLLAHRRYRFDLPSNGDDRAKPPRGAMPCRARQRDDRSDEAAAGRTQSHEQRRQIHERGNDRLICGARAQGVRAIGSKSGFRIPESAYRKRKSPDCSRISRKLPSKLPGNMAARALVSPSVRNSAP